jgi:predicted nucleic acid-binding protein
MKAVVLDSGPLSVTTQRPGHSPEVNDCQTWFASLEEAGIQIYIPEVADYEVRRELVRLGKSASLARLDALNRRANYIPITTAAMRRAAELWAEVRRHGQPTAGAESLDGDVILAAEVLVLELPDLVVATSNARHLARFLSAENWHDIKP